MARFFHQKFNLLNFLHRRHSPLLRYPLATAAWLGAYAITGSRVSAHLLQRHFIADDFKQGVRLANWFAVRGWPPFYQQDDPFFDFTEGLEPAEIESLQLFLAKRRDLSGNEEFLTDLLFLKAATIHVRLAEGCESVNDLVAQFYRMTDLLLSRIGKPSGQVVARQWKRKNKFSKKDAIRALADFSGLFPVDEWRWYVISGTFLGLYREGGFLLHDHDIDLGVDHGRVDLELMLRNLAEHPDFIIKKVFDHLFVSRENGRYVLQRKPALIKVFHKSKMDIDIFVHHREGDLLWHGSFFHRWNNRLFKLREYSLEGLRVLGPLEAERYLTENYGDWKTPAEEFHCSTCTPNLAVAKNFLSLALALRRLAYFSRHDLNSYTQFRNMLLRTNVLSQDGPGLKVSEYIS